MKKSTNKKADVLKNLPESYQRLYNQIIPFKIGDKRFAPKVNVRVNNLDKKPPLYLNEISGGQFRYISSLYPLSEPSSTHPEFRFDYKTGDEPVHIFKLKCDENGITVEEEGI